MDGYGKGANSGSLQDQIDQWLTRGIEPHATCVRCGHVTHARGLRGGNVHVVCGHLAVMFWNCHPSTMIDGAAG